MNSKTVLKTLIMLATVGIIAWYLKAIIIYFAVSFLILLAGRPLMNLILKIKVKNIALPRTIAALLTLILICTVITGLFYALIPLVITEIYTFSNVDMDLLLHNYQNLINIASNTYSSYASMSGETMPVNELVANKITSFLSLPKILEFIKNLSSALGSIAIGIFSIIFITFFLLRDENILLRLAVLMLPKQQESDIISVSNTITGLLRRYFFGIFVRSTFVFILLFFGLLFTRIGTEHAVLIALMAAILNIIPYIGPILGTILGLIIGAMVGITTHTQFEPAQLLLFILVITLLVQLLDMFILQPLISSKSIDAHPLEIFTVILASGYIGGIVGMILGVPVYTVIRVIAKVFYFNSKR